MRVVRGFILGIAILLASCSSDKRPELSLNDMDQPPPAALRAGCSVRPDQVGDASYLGSEGSGRCTVREAWNIRSVEGVAFSQPATVNCTVASAYHDWLTNVAQPAAQQFYGSKIVTVHTPSTFSCRTRSSKRGAKLSEHGTGNAIDISAFTLANGTVVDLQRDYYRSKFLQHVRKHACGRFKTVIGPGTDAAHADHFHFDMAYRKSGLNYCH
jgi:hypothetical protein